MASETSEAVEVLARHLFMKADATGIWHALDEGNRLYWRKEAVRRLQRERYKENPQLLIDESA